MQLEKDVFRGTLCALLLVSRISVTHCVTEQCRSTISGKP